MTRLHVRRPGQSRSNKFSSSPWIKQARNTCSAHRVQGNPAERKASDACSYRKKKLAANGSKFAAVRTRF